MSNEIVQQYEIDPYAEFAEEVSTRAHIVGDMLRFTKHGEYKAGTDQLEIPEGTRMLAYMPSLKRGWVKWWDGSPVQHVLGLVGERYRPPARDALGDMDESEWGMLNDRRIDPWQKTNYLVMCDEEARLYTFVTGGKGGMSAVGEVADVYAMRRRMKPLEIPILELQSRSYKHKEFGETFAPKFVIVGWSPIPDTFAEVAASLKNREVTAEITAPQQQELEFSQASEPELEPEPEPEPEPARKLNFGQSTVKPKPKTTGKAAPPQKPRRNSGKSLRL